MSEPHSPCVLAIETSCDETAVAVLRGKDLLASEVASQILLHREYGGVVPEVASREHLGQLDFLIDKALAVAGVECAEIDVFAATAGPGLASSLMIGTSAAKGLAIGFNKPYIAVNHLEGHLLSPFFGKEVVPSIGLVVSGGHTLLLDIGGFKKYRMLGRTLDDAAGEAFDKIGKLLGLPYPAGPVVDRLALEGKPDKYQFPRSMINSRDYNFSFSGLKTSVRYMLPKLHNVEVKDVCASFQEAIVEVLVEKSVHAALQQGREVIALSGGVSCNSRLKNRIKEIGSKNGLSIMIAEPSLSTDNAAMIAYVAALSFEQGVESSLESDINPNLELI